MPAASVSVRRHAPLPRGPGAADEIMADEAGRWGLYGEVVSQHIDADRHVISVIEPRRRGGLIALRAQVATSHDHAIHHGPDHARP